MRVRALVLCAGAIACAGPLASERSPTLDSLPTPSLVSCPQHRVMGMGRTDVVVVIDASRSTLDPTGQDVNGNGKIGRPLVSRVGGPFDLGSTDTGDSYLAAQVVAARSLLQGFASTDVRFGIVSFSESSQQQITHAVSRVSGSDHEAALARILEVGSAGDSDFAEGISAARESLVAATSPGGPSRRLALFMSDSTAPVPSAGRGYDPRVERAAGQAASDKVVFDTFWIGDRGTGEANHLEAIARTTGGRYRAVSASELPCALADSLMP